MHVSAFPNLALLLGPNSGLGHSSLVRIMESQMLYLLQWLDEVEQTSLPESLDVAWKCRRDTT